MLLIGWASKAETDSIKSGKGAHRQLVNTGRLLFLFLVTGLLRQELLLRSQIIGAAWSVLSCEVPETGITVCSQAVRVRVFAIHGALPRLGRGAERTAAGLGWNIHNARRANVCQGSSSHSQRPNRKHAVRPLSSCDAALLHWARCTFGNSGCGSAGSDVKSPSKDDLLSRDISRWCRTSCRLMISCIASLCTSEAKGVRTEAPRVTHRMRTMADAPPCRGWRPPQRAHRQQTHL